MKVLGYSSLNHDSSVTLIEDGVILACYSEERFTRDKYDMCSSPWMAFDQIQKDFNFDISDPDVVVSTATPVWTDHDFLKKILEKKREVWVYEHGDAHAMGSYLTSGFKEKTLVIAFDSTSSSNFFKRKVTADDLDKVHKQEFNSNYFNVYIGEGTDLTLMERVNGNPTGLSCNYFSAINNVGGYWSTMTTKAYDFKPKDEGKIMGLAPQGNFDKKLYDKLEELFNFDNGVSPVYQHFLNDLKVSGYFEDDQNRKDFAYTMQRVSEDFIINLLNDLHKKYPECRKLCLSGGFFANVKVNQKINEYLGFEELYVIPAMGDDGLSLGAALLKANELGIAKNKRLENAFLGKGYTNDEIYDTIKDRNITIKPLDTEYLAEQLASGKLVGLFRGRAEYGPRALGNRTILCDPRARENHAYINRKLGRNEIMPFAPIIMSEYISDVCYAYKSLRAAEFMTLCFTVKDKWIDRVQAVVQNDDATCRAQVIFKERNPFCSDVLSEFNKITGVPVLLNTSFNIHGEPIINHPIHAMDHLQNGIVDILVLNNMIVEMR